MSQVSQRLAEFVIGLEAGALPSPVRDRMRLLVLDSVGVTLAAAPLGESRPVIDFVEEMGGVPEASVVGGDVRLPARSAAYANSWLADLLDFEDTQKFGGNHPGSTMLPVAIAIGQRQGSSGAEILTALVAGYEVANRIARGVFPNSTLRGFLSNGASGAIGSAATAARLLGLDVIRTTHAINIAGFLLPISAADTLWEGESAKPAHAAQAAATGIDAALLAARGMTGAPLEGGRRGLGYLRMIGDTVNTDVILGGLGETYTLMDLAIKAYPACGYTNGAIDAALALRARIGGDVARISSAKVSTYRLAAIAVDRHTDPASTFTACQFSLPYTVAAALIDGQFGVEQLSAARRTDPAVHALGSVIELVEDPELTAEFPTKLPYRIDAIVDGEVVSESVDAPLGTAQNPMSDAQVRDKYRRIVGPILGGAESASFERRIDRLEELSSFEWPAVNWSREAVPTA
jgi:2-methylcitrate dehydratase PrpD